MTVLVTGAAGFVGRNLVAHLAERGGIRVLTYTRGNQPSELEELVSQADAVIHLAGENRPADPAGFIEGNIDLTKSLCDTLERVGRPIPLLFTSSTQATLDNPYGISKRQAEDAVEDFAARSKTPVAIWRLPGVFGKWCRPNYNSVVATFCHNIARGLPIQVNNPQAALQLVYIDDVVRALIERVNSPWTGLIRPEVAPVHQTTVGHLAETIQDFRDSREHLTVGGVGVGLERALYATYVSYLPEPEFSYPLIVHGDERGVFVEMLKTRTSGQMSFFTIKPGVTRGSHYHHTKTEKFLVVKGGVRMRFRCLQTERLVEVDLDAKDPRVVDSIPGWVHDITNVSDEEAIVMLWANEIFDRSNPDTVQQPV